jgi:hypothetical protein
MIKQLLAAAALFATPALADSPWLVKSQDSGYVMPADWATFTCRIYSDRVEIVRYVGAGISTKEVHAITLTGDIESEIRLAAAESLTDSGTLCDLPGTSITAHLPTDGDQDGLLLYGQSTCFQDGERRGEHSTPLINLTNGLCDSLH